MNRNVIVLIGIFFGIAQVAMGQCDNRKLASLKKEYKKLAREFGNKCNSFRACVARAEHMVTSYSNLLEKLEEKGRCQGAQPPNSSGNLAERLSRLNGACFAKKAISDQSNRLKVVASHVSKFKSGPCRSFLFCWDLAYRIGQKQEELHPVQSNCPNSGGSSTLDSSYNELSDVTQPGHSVW